MVIFIDDLQWLDPATLALVQYLIIHRDTQHLLLIGAYRDNEVGPEHPLALALDTILKTDTRISELRLDPLSIDDVVLVEDYGLERRDGDAMLNSGLEGERRERDERALEELRSTGSVQLYEKEYLRKDSTRAPFARLQVGRCHQGR